MNIKGMLDALQLKKKKCDHHELCTVWGEQLNREQILTQYPRPQLVRKQYDILNGWCEYAITTSSSFPEKWDGQICIPFSPETKLSGVERQLQPTERLWYHKEFVIPKKKEGQRLILHIGACDERCKIYMNKKEIAKHCGGYLAFEVDVTDAIVEGTNLLEICVRDKSDTSYHARGKQKLKCSGMFYTAQSGIWQTMWSEWVPDTYVTSIKLTPFYDESEVRIELFPNKNLTQTSEIRWKVCVYDKGILVCEKEQQGCNIVTLTIPNKKSWSPVNPFLYDVKIRYGEDEFTSYFGMRHFSIEPDANGFPRLCLNHVPYFQKGVLDQGYWPESLLTPPSDEAMIYDIQTAKDLGYNMIRKHCKIEPMRWYYHCDRLGMLVWQDMVNGGEMYHPLLTTYLPTVFRRLRSTKDTHYFYTARKNPKGREEWRRECKETIELLYNHPCICTWVLFNEGWGQFDAVKNTELARTLDNTRFIDAHSGWFDQNAGDLKSEHIYFFQLMVKRGEKPYVISEFGGLLLGVKDHVYSDNYFGYETYQTLQDLKEAYDAINDRVEVLIAEGLCASVYTQLTDIEEEVNGLMTYDRKIRKV